MCPASHDRPHSQEAQSPKISSPGAVPEDLLAEILLTEEDDCDNDAAEAGVAGAMLLAAMGDQEPSEAP